MITKIMLIRKYTIIKWIRYSGKNHAVLSIKYDI